MQSCVCLCRVSIDVPHSEGHRKAVVSDLMFPCKKTCCIFLLDSFICLNENFFKYFQLSTSTKILRNLDKVVLVSVLQTLYFMLHSLYLYLTAVITYY